MQEESEAFEIFSGWYNKRLSALYELNIIKGKKLVKLRVSQTVIDAVKESCNLG